jgi:membrane protein YqaA with SNARE-associated domain
VIDLGGSMLAKYAGLAVAGFVSATLIPIGAEPVLVPMVVSGEVAAVPAVLVATLGNVAGAVVNYALGRGGRRLVDKRFDAVFERAEKWIHRFGAPALVVSWLPFIGDPMTLVAGASRIGFVPFLLWTAPGRLARYAAVVALGERAAEWLPWLS